MTTREANADGAVARGGRGGLHAPVRADHRAMMGHLSEGWLCGMRELWGRTWESIRQYPALCLPVVWASALAYGWEQLRIMCSREMPILLLQTHSHSVLTGSVAGFAQPGSAQYLSAILLSGLVSHACNLANVCCFLVALMMTAKMLKRYTTGTSQVRLMSWRLIGFSVGFYVMGLLCFLLVFLAAAQLATHAHKSYLLAQPVSLGLQMGLVCVLLSYLLAPAALRLVAKSCGHVVAVGVDKAARVYATIASVVLTVIDVAVTRIRVTGRSSPLETVLTSLFITIAIALPYIPLFVAMGLLALEGPEEEPVPAG